MKGFTVRLAIAAASLVGLLAFGTAPSLANHVRCGDTITQDTKLDSDLDCAAVGISVAEGVTLNLNGHTIRFTGPESIAVSLENGATIKDGRIVGVVDDSVHPLALPCRRGVSGHSGVTVTRVTVEHCTQGILLRGSNNTVVRNEVREYANPDGGETSTIGILVGLTGDGQPLGTHNVVSRNVLSNINPAGEVTAGMAIYGADLVDRNTSEGNGRGITVEALPGAVVERNFVSGSSGLAAMIVELESGARAVRNEVVGGGGLAAARIGIRVGGPGPALVEQNSASGFSITGIDVQVPGLEMRKNRANDNGEWGIKAVEGTIDGGKNKASGNGNPLQCLNVFCK